MYVNSVYKYIPPACASLYSSVTQIHIDENMNICMCEYASINTHTPHLHSHQIRTYMRKHEYAYITNTRTHKHSLSQKHTSTHTHTHLIHSIAKFQQNRTERVFQKNGANFGQVHFEDAQTHVVAAKHGGGI